MTKKSLKKRVQKKKTPKNTSRGHFISIDQEIWPIESNILFRPGRMKYVRKLIEFKGCVFCNTAQNQMSAETLCVYKTKYSQIVLNKFPYNSGHVLVLPLRHCGDFLSLSSEEYLDLMKTLKLAIEAVVGIYNPQGYNVGLNNGMTAGAGIPDHLHFHLVPRWNGDLNFFPLIADTKLVTEEVSDTYQKFVHYFKDKESL